MLRNKLFTIAAISLAISIIGPTAMMAPFALIGIGFGIVGFVSSFFDNTPRPMHRPTQVIVPTAPQPAAIYPPMYPSSAQILVQPAYQHSGAIVHRHPPQGYSSNRPAQHFKNPIHTHPAAPNHQNHNGSHNPYYHAPNP